METCEAEGDDGAGGLQRAAGVYEAALLVDAAEGAAADVLQAQLGRPRNGSDTSRIKYSYCT